MNKAAGGKSALTSNTAILLYYICALLSLFTGFTLLFVAVAALVSRSVAYKEGAPLVIQHCTWLFRSIWVFVLLALLLGSGAMYMVNETFTTLPDMSHVTSFSHIWADPQLSAAVKYATLFAMVGGALVLWFLYRIVRGGFALLCYSPPVRI